MRIDNAVATDVLERMLASYGFVMQKELAERLGIAKSNVAGWLQRGQIPGNAIVQCALDTGADVNWLVTGELANASYSTIEPTKKGKALLDTMLSSGGKAVLRRMLDAYGFKTQKELGDLLEISSGTISTWIRRDYFPGEIVITCALDTGVSLEWLATGLAKSPKENNTAVINESESFRVGKKLLIAGKLEENGSCVIDGTFLPQGLSIERLCLVKAGNRSWIIELGLNEISNGSWLLDIDGILDVYAVSRRPGNQLHIIGNDAEFDCAADQVIAKGVVAAVINQTV